MKIGVLGSGVVGQTLAAGFLKHGHQVMAGTQHRPKMEEWAAKNPEAKVGSFADAAKFGEVLVLAVKGSAAAEVLREAAAEDLRGKLVMDACNPISGGPEKGVLPFYTDMNSSLMEALQREFPESKLVKVFNSVGAGQMVNPSYEAGKPTMFICGNDDTAKKTVTKLLDELGWESADMGGVEAARAIEPLCILWCIPGFLRNEWTHAFKLLRG